MMVARAFLSLTPRSWKNARVAFSCSLHPLQISLFSFGFTGATFLVAVGASNSLIILNGGGPCTGGGGNKGSDAVLVVTAAARGRATVKKFCIKID
jgi:hypothetical protein